MVWNTIAHPKKMMDSNPGGLGITRTYSPIKFADPHKLSFYDIIVSMISTSDGRQPILVKGDFETLKHMILNDEAVCGAVFESELGVDVKSQKETEITRFDHDSVLNCIVLYPFVGDPLYLLSDNTISETEPNGEDIELNPTPSNPGALG